MFKKSDFNFDLSDSSIAKYPLAQRDKSRLLVYKNGEVQHHNFDDLPTLLTEPTLLVMNNAKVIPARLYFQRATGALIEVLILEPVEPASYEENFNATESCTWKCIIGNSKKWKDEETIELADNKGVVSAKLIDRAERLVQFQWQNGVSFTKLLDQIGELPIPPYLNRDTDQSDYQTYQTVFAKNAGSVAAPTAGLHFTKDVFDELYKRNVTTTEVTLHVGAGTFLPVKEENVLHHAMHREHFEITTESIRSLIKNTNRIAVGTTSLRVLESLYWLGLQMAKGQEQLVVKKLEPYEIEATMTYTKALQSIVDYMEIKNIKTLNAATEIMILPHYQPRSVKAIITNFHLPESTLLMLIASVVGDHWQNIYKTALENDYRFLSYGDSSLLFVE